MPLSICNINIDPSRCFGGQGDDPSPCVSGFQSAVSKEVENLVSLVWNSTLGGAVNLLCLVCNAKKLDDKMRQLKAQMEQMWRTIVDAENPIVVLWMNRVEELNKRVESFQTDLRSWKAYVKFLCLSYSAANMLREVEGLMNEHKEFKDLVGPALPRSGESQFIPAHVNREDERFLGVWEHLRDDRAHVIGVWGRAGVGKTTLLRIINSKFCGPDRQAEGYKEVIWVSLSQISTEEEIQTMIGDKLKWTPPTRESRAAALESPESRAAALESRAAALNSILSKSKFLLLLDDVRDSNLLNFGKIGIPDLNKNKSKIVFTTVSPEIAREGTNYVVELERLGQEQSSDLFLALLSKDARRSVDADPRIKFCAEGIVRLCDGVPVVLVIAARLIPWQAGSHEEWGNIFCEFQDTIEKESIDTSPGMELEGMKPYLSSLRLTFELLPTDTLRNCYLYCFLFPTGREIDSRQLLEYWIGEGLLDNTGECNKIDAIRSRGARNIRDLVNVSLLFYGRNELVNTVRLAKFASLMAKNILSEGPDGRNKFVVCAGKEIGPVPEVQGWENAERVSLMKSNIQRLPNTIPTCRNLLTLLINNNPQLVICTPINAVYQSLFQLVTHLQVLDLSSTSVAQLPSGIQLLVDLRYLNLSHTKILSLPAELGNLAELRQLDLTGTKELSTIPQEVLSRLEKLQALNLYDSAYYLSVNDVPNWSNLQQLDELGVNIKVELPLTLSTTPVSSIGPITRFLTLGSSQEGSSPNQTIRPVEDLELDNNLFPNLEVLQLLELPLSAVVFGEGFRKLRRLYISRCHELRNLGRVQQLTSLEVIHVYECNKIEELLTEERGGGNCSWPYLEEVHLESLPNLRTISKSRTLTFSPDIVKVIDCPNFAPSTSMVKNIVALICKCFGS